VGSLAVTQHGLAQTDVELWTSRLATVVLAAETRELAQLLGHDDQADKTIDVQFVMQPAPGHQAAGARPAGRLSEVVDYYRAVRPQRLVITGAPGAGKTVLALRLMLGVLTDSASGARVPVRLSAASWDTVVPLPDWVSGHLVSVFRLPPRTAAALVAAGRVLPVIDGLDEMDATTDPGHQSRAAHALAALNRYQDHAGKAAVIVTCRTDHYDSLIDTHAWVHDSARIQITPVDPDTAQTFVETRIGTHDLPRWQHVLDALDFYPDGPLARALNTPWRLTLAITVYQQRDPDTGRYLRDPGELTDRHLSTPGKIRDHLLAAYIPAAAGANGPRRRRYRPDHIHIWLATLARYLTTNTDRPPLAGRTLSSTDIILHELWPLAGAYRVRALSSASLAFIWLASLVIHQTRFRIGAGQVVVAIVMVALVWSIPWPAAPTAGLRRVWPRSWQRSLTLVLILPIGVAYGFFNVFTFGEWSGIVAGLAAGACATMAISFASWLALAEEAARRVHITDPRQAVRSSFKTFITVGVGVGIFTSLPAAFGAAQGVLSEGIYPPEENKWLGLILGLSLALSLGSSFGFLAGLADMRYTALLLGTRRPGDHWLPWRLRRFLHWCYADAGLLRVAGAAYQFRHRELQDYLAQHPAP
jgi:Sec-independent protein secretion pathway component TatC